MMMWAAAGLVVSGLLLVVVGFARGTSARRQRLAEALDFELAAEQRASATMALVYERVLRWTEARAEGTPLSERLLQRLERGRVALRPTEFLLIWAGTAVVCGLLGGVFGWEGALVGSVLGALIPPAMLARRAARWQREFEAQLPDVLDLAASSMEAGHSLLTALQLVAEDAPAPIGEELRRVLSETQVGRPLLEALDAMALRLDCADFTWTVEGVRVQQEVGGRLSELLRTLAGFMRAREEVRRELRALVAEGKMSMYVLGALPFAMLAFLFVAAPAYVKPLFTESVGHALLLVAAILMSFAFVVMRRIVKLEV